VTDVDKIAFAVGWYELRQCPGCFAPLESVAGKGAGHSTADGAIRGGGPRGDMCEWSADDLAALVHIGSGMVKYHSSTDRSRRPSVGETAPSRETAPTRLLR
jgi:hypothetical protein